MVQIFTYTPFFTTVFDVCPHANWEIVTNNLTTVVEVELIDDAVSKYVCVVNSTHILCVCVCVCVCIHIYECDLNEMLLIFLTSLITVQKNEMDISLCFKHLDKWYCTELNVDFNHT